MTFLRSGVDVPRGEWDECRIIAVGRIILIEVVGRIIGRMARKIVGAVGICLFVCSCFVE